MDSQLLLGVRTLRDKMGRWLTDPNPVWGIPTGFPSWDELTGGLHGGEMTVIGGRTHHGKTTFLNQVAFNIASRFFTQSIRKKILLFTPEMTVDAVLLRMACILAAVPTSRIQSGSATSDEVDRVETCLAAIEGLDDNLWVFGGGALDISAIVQQAENMNLIDDIAGVFVDYLTYIGAGTSASGPRESASHVSRRLATLAIDLEVPVVVGAQLSREIEKRGFSKNEEEKLPQLSDIAESGQIERDASCVGLLYNPPDLAKSLRGEAQTATLMVRKNRSTGRLGDVGLIFDNRTGQFVDETEWDPGDVQL